MFERGYIIQEQLMIIILNSVIVSTVSDTLGPFLSIDTHGPMAPDNRSSLEV